MAVTESVLYTDQHDKVEHEFLKIMDLSNTPLAISSLFL